MLSLDDLEPDHATSVSKHALQLMAELEVPATPPNFTVWFAYVLGRSAALRRRRPVGSTPPRTTAASGRATHAVAN